MYLPKPIITYFEAMYVGVVKKCRLPNAKLAPKVPEVLRISMAEIDQTHRRIQNFDLSTRLLS